MQADELKERAKVGYRGDRIVRLAQAFRDGSVDVAWLESRERTRCVVLRRTFAALREPTEDEVLR